MSVLQLQPPLELVEQASEVDRHPSAALRAADQLIAWCQAVRVQCVQRLQATGSLHELSPTPLRTDRENDTLLRWADVATRAPGFAAALARARIGAGHLDELGRTLRRLDGRQQRALLRDEGRLLAVAEAGTAAEFGRFLRREERRLGREAGMSTLQQQQGAVRLTAHTDRDTGMRRYTLSLDPLSATSFEQRLDAAVEALFHDSPPPGCPSDPLERHQFLRAHALLRLSEGGGGAAGRPEFIVVIDTTTGDAAPHIDWGLPVEIPARVLHDLWHEAHVVPVVVRNGVVLHAPGELDLGRSTRLANRAQRRALRAMYPTCAVPGCEVHFQHCKIHHVVWWRHGGRTDLRNLLPLCHRHHLDVHRNGWDLALAADRTLTVRTPDGRRRTTGPPRRRGR
jgi:hypothetical protein